MMKVPFLDLKQHHAPLLQEFSAAIQEVINSGTFAGGPQVEQFEEEFARYCQCQHAIGVGSGTEALWLVLLALGIGKEDEVITVPNSFMATAEAITYCGAQPRFVDIDPCTYTMDPQKLASAITSRTKAIIPVHIFGQPADMEPIQRIAQEHGLPIISDACQAHGAEYKSSRTALCGDAACYSFYPGKNLGAFGEAGAITTDNAHLAQKIRILRDHGQTQKYHHSMVGWNCRMDGIQAAVLKVKLKHLDQNNNHRRHIAQRYQQILGAFEEVVLPQEAEYAHHVYHIYAIRCEHRDQLMQALAMNGVGCGIHYPVPIHLQEAYKPLGYSPGDFPVAEQCAKEFLSLPLYPELSDIQLEYVTNTLKQALSTQTFQKCSLMFGLSAGAR